MNPIKSQNCVMCMFNQGMQNCAVIAGASYCCTCYAVLLKRMKLLGALRQIEPRKTCNRACAQTCPRLQGHSWVNEVIVNSA